MWSMWMLGVYGGEEGQPDAEGDWVDCGDGEGGDGGWTWGWFNGNPEDVPESWSGSDSNALASQD